MSSADARTAAAAKASGAMVGIVNGSTGGVTRAIRSATTVPTAGEIVRMATPIQASSLSSLEMKAFTTKTKRTATNPTIPAAHTNARLVTKRSRVPPRPGAPEAARARTAATQANHAMLSACNRIARTRAHRTYPTPWAVFAGHDGYIG